MKRRNIFNLALITGLVIGIMAAIVQAFFKVQPPIAYGICLIGHPRDLTAWLSNNLFDTSWTINEAFIIFPTLTVLGVILGAITSAYRNNEWRFRSGPVRNRFYAFMFGFLVVNFGLAWGSCPIRTGLLVSYGNIMAVIVLISITAGVLFALLYIKFRVKREKY